MERIWLKSYPEGVPADIDPTAYALAWRLLRGQRRYVTGTASPTSA